MQRKYNNPTRAYLSGSWGKSGGNNCWVSIIDNLEWTTGIQDIAPVPESQVFPNPVVQQRFTTRFTNETAQHLVFEILDMQGRRIALMLDTYIKQGLNEFSFTTDQLAAGNYIFKISTRAGLSVATHKLSIK